MPVFLLQLIFALSLWSCGSSQKQKKPQQKAQTYFSLGTEYLQSKEYTKALQYLIKAANLDPKDSEIQNNLGMAYFLKKDTDTALIHLKKAISLDPKNSDAQNNLASIYFHQGEYLQARNIYQKILKDLTYQNQFRIQYNLGLIFAKEKKYDQAEKLFSQSLKENTHYCPAHNEIGKIFFDQGKFLEALEAFQKATQGTCYNNPAPQYSQALCLIKLKKYREAKLKLEFFIQSFPNSHKFQEAKEKLQVLNDYQHLKVNSSPDMDRF